MCALNVKKDISVFDALRVKRSSTGKTVTKGDFYFMLVQINGSYSLRTVDAKGGIIELDYRVLRGMERTLAKAMESARISSGWSIEWEDDLEDAVNLDQNSHLMKMLEPCPGIVDQRMRPVVFDPGLYTLELQFESVEQTSLEGKLVLVADNGRRTTLTNSAFVTSEYLLSKGVLFQIHSVGERLSFPSAIC